MPIAASGISTKFASSASETSRMLRSGARIWATVRLSPTSSMLETTKQSVAIGTALLRSSIVTPPLHPGDVFPEAREAVRPTEQGREDRRVRHEDVTGAGVLRGHPEARVEFRVAGGGEGVRPL